MSRLAWFTPLPPIRSGVSWYNAELLSALAQPSGPDADLAHGAGTPGAIVNIDVFVDGDPHLVQPPSPAIEIFNAHDFVWKHFRRPYHLVVYQLGNATCHDYMWAYLARYPGLVVLHDGQLHHARGRLLLQQKRTDDYRREFAFNHPEADTRLAEVGVAGLLGSLTYFWPMRRIVVESARLLAVHNEWLADDIRDEQPSASVEVIPMGVPACTPPADAREQIRARHNVPPHAPLFVALGDVTPEKRISQAIRALAAMADHVPDAHLLLAGKAVAHYDALEEARALGVADRVGVSGFVPHEEIASYLEAADVCLCMRWQSSRETSAAWLRCLAAGRPTIITDLVHTADTPALDPRTWSPLHSPHAFDDLSGHTEFDPVSVSIDIVDEDHSLRLAMRRLATDAGLRSALGSAARRLWQRRHTLDAMRDRYREVIRMAVERPVPAPLADLPAHFAIDGTEHASDLAREMGVSESRIADIWRTRSAQLD